MIVSSTAFVVRQVGRRPKKLRMEYFYREMRRKTGLLLDNFGEPLGGK